jgi:hypothetical protein
VVGNYTLHATKNTARKKMESRTWGAKNLDRGAKPLATGTKALFSRAN